jgi:mono/diheme cytochrome c family protein
MRYFFVFLFCLALVVVFAAGFRGQEFKKPPIELIPDMDHQAKVKAQSRSDVFADGMGARVPVPGTVPMGFSVPDAPVSSGNATPSDDAFALGIGYYDTGRFGDYYGDGIPQEIEVDAAFLARGRERFDIHCAVCHGQSGNGKGATSQFGILNAANFHTPAFKVSTDAAYRPDGSIYDTITNGKGLMGAYGANITVRDRWAIVAWVRALQSLGDGAAK